MAFGWRGSKAAYGAPAGRASVAGGMSDPEIRADPEPLRALVGPTASGKTALAIEVALASGAEIVSLDSMLVYRGMDVGTAKPSAEAPSPGLRSHAVA